MSNYVRPLSEVRQVKETYDTHEVNDLVQNGWMLLAVAKSDDKESLFSLGFPEKG